MQEMPLLPHHFPMAGSSCHWKAESSGDLCDVLFEAGFEHVGGGGLMKFSSMKKGGDVQNIKISD